MEFKDIARPIIQMEKKAIRFFEGESPAPVRRPQGFERTAPQNKQREIVRMGSDRCVIDVDSGRCENQYKSLTASPKFSKDAQARREYQEAVGDLGYVTIDAKLVKARGISDPLKREKVLSEARALMIQYFNISRDPTLPAAVREKILDTLKDYKRTVRELAPGNFELQGVAPALDSPQNSYQKLESLVAGDPDLANLHSVWRERKERMGLQDHQNASRSTAFTKHIQ